MSPILITVYDRIEHLTNCIDRLLENPEAKESILYVSSDAQYRPEDGESVSRVRSFISKISGFKEVVAIFHRENLGAYNATQKAIDEVFLSHDRLIFLEDDILVSNGFLAYMNTALDTYRFRDDIFFICSYMWPGFDFSRFSAEDVFIWRGYSPWGMATWREKWSYIDFDLNGYNDFSSDKGLVKDFFSVDPDFLELLREDRAGSVIAMDVRISFNIFKLGKYSVFPVANLSVNRGHDGAGDHGSNCMAYMGQGLSELNPCLPNALQFDPEIQRYIFNKKFSILRHRLRPLLVSIGVFPYLRNALNRVGVYSYIKNKWVVWRGFS